MRKNTDDRSLATERDIDPDFGLFEDGPQAAVPDAGQMLASKYPATARRRPAKARSDERTRR